MRVVDFRESCELIESSRYGNNAATTSVPGAAVSTSILAANPKRKKAIIFNNTNRTIYLSFVDPAVAGFIPVPRDAFWEETFYRGEIWHISTGGVSDDIEITEITT